MKNDNEFQQFQRDHVNLNKTRRVELNERMQALDGFLSKNLHGFIRTERQGSRELRTIIRPTADDVKADADMLVIVKRESGDCKTYVPALWEALAGSEQYRDKITMKNLCVTVHYSERSKLEVDLVPCVESGGKFYVCPRDGDEFQETDGTGYRDWFNAQNEITSGNLKRVVRLLKYARDHRERFDCPSIVLTTLAAETIRPDDGDGESVSTQADALTTVLARMSERLERTPYPLSIRNPALASEEFDPGWTCAEYSRFKAVIRRMSQDAKDALRETDKEKSIAAWQRVCGEKFAAGQGGGIGTKSASAIPAARRREAAPFG